MATPKTKDQTSATRPLRRVVKLSARVGLTLGIAALALVAVQAGSSELARRADAAPAPMAVAAMPVQTQVINFEEGYKITRSFVGQVEPAKTVMVSFERAGQLAEIHVDEGDDVAAGAPIARLDTRLLVADRARLEASRNALQAQLQFANQTVERQAELNTRGFASEAVLDQATATVDELAARIAEIDAALLSNTLEHEKATVFAPFAGRVTARFVDGGESLGAGQALIELVAQAAPQVRVGLPLDLGPDDLQSVEFEVAGQRHAARLRALRPDVDPVTRTRTAIFEMNADAPLVFGQTVRLDLAGQVDETGFWVPLTTLKEGVRGQWTVLGVDTDNVVRAINVLVLHTEGGHAFVSGAVPQGVVMITDGPQRVTTGQRVSPQPDVAITQ